MSSIVSICNLALSNLGKDNISALTDEGAEARACNQFYDHVRDTLLQVYPWSFAGKTASLAEVTNDKAGRGPMPIAARLTASRSALSGRNTSPTIRTITARPRSKSPSASRMRSRADDLLRSVAGFPALHVPQHRSDQVFAACSSRRCPGIWPSAGYAADARSQDARRRLSACPGHTGASGGG
jgi:hypothetical protein